jgi:hypothetical protein
MVEGSGMICCFPNVFEVMADMASGTVNAEDLERVVYIQFRAQFGQVVNLKGLAYDDSCRIPG